MMSKVFCLSFPYPVTLEAAALLREAPLVKNDEMFFAGELGALVVLLGLKLRDNSEESLLPSPLCPENCCKGPGPPSLLP